MKKLYYFIITLGLLGNLNSQTQIGADIDGENTGDESGFSVSLSSNGNVVAIGAPYNNGNGTDSGHVRVYENQSGTWVQIGSDINGEAAEDKFGWSLSISSDGTTVAIGAANNDGNGTSAGHVQVYNNQGGNWIQIGADIDGASAGYRLGRAVSLSSDGNMVAVSAPWNSNNGGFSGYVLIYENQGGNWVQIGSAIEGESALDYSGSSLSLSSDGSTVAIGARLNDGNGLNAGHVRVYENQAGNWVQVGSDIDGKFPADNFGESVSISSDGSMVAAGAPGNNGYASIYQNQGGNWVQVGTNIEGENSVDNFGQAISISANGNIVAIGGPENEDNGIGSGHTRIYKNQGGNWVQVGIDIDGENSSDNSGEAISISADGNVVAIGARDNNDGGFGSGHVRVYDLSGVLSIKEQAFSDFSLYPNPTKDQFTIQFNKLSYLNRVRIYNNFGQLVLTSKETTINTSKLASGLYIVEVETNQGTSTKKIIIE